MPYAAQRNVSMLKQLLAPIGLAEGWHVFVLLHDIIDGDHRSISNASRSL